MKQICINCALLSGEITGIERYVYENIKRIDYLAEKSRQSLPKKNQIQSQSKSCTYESFCSSNSLSGKDL